MPHSTLSVLDPAEFACVRQALARHHGVPGALLPILHDVQHALGHVPHAALAPIADALNLSRAEVFGVVSFYHYFRHEPSGRARMFLCRAEACQAVGADRLAAHAQATLGIEFNGTTADGAITLESAYCLGNCALGPSLLVGGDLHGRVTPQRFDEIVAGVQGDRG